MTAIPACRKDKPLQNLCNRYLCSGCRISDREDTDGMPSVPRGPAAAATEADAPAVGLAVAEAATRVGVVPSTLRSWERRYGLGPSHHTIGGHRRYSAADIALLQRLRRLVDAGMPTAAAAIAARQDSMTGREGRNRPDLCQPNGGRAARSQSMFTSAAQALDGPRLTRLATATLNEYGAVPAWVDVFAPVLEALGGRWQCTGAAIEREHLAAAVLHAALLRHAVRHAPRRPRATVLAAATPQEGHTLPLDALAAALAELGVLVSPLGTLPESALHAAIEELAPTAVVLWARSAATRAPALLRGLLGHSAMVCAAGPGWSVRQLPAGVTHVKDLPTAVDKLLGLTR